MAGQGDTQLEDCDQTSPGVTLTENLIATRNLPQLVEPLHPESRSTELLSPSTIRLDRENICTIGRLQSLREIHSLYLQQNQIEKIENLGCFPNLRYGQRSGRGLGLPKRCLRELVVGALPHLLQLDAQPICGSKGEEEEDGGSSSSEDEDNQLLSDPSDPFTAGKDFFADLHRELAGRSQRRRRECLEEHWTRLEELEELRERRGLLLPPAPLSPGREGAAPGPRRSQPPPQAKPGTHLPPLPGPSGQHACLQLQRAPGRSQPRTKETHAKGARNRQLPAIPRTRMAPRSCN
ncbi:PREDICTED: leucine-rich repeat-containing protein 46 [Charadrius vociferus]|uniref:leucine-rich repeat-containing protein 46 n=1 Tax=Charadrius vociferus TaxID=50402 RepID=UPI0005215708|nr:PREDICTED: leucine-rich repeat-containing protein 46 [Charadrius vociferus]